MNRLERHPARTLVLFLLLVVGVLVAVTEALLSRLDGTQVDPFEQERYVRLREWKPASRWSFAPPAARRENAGGEVLPGYDIVTDAKGFIEPTGGHAAPQVEIVFLGGSTTECLYVSPEKRFPYLAGRLLEEGTGLRVNAYNGGKSGNNLMHSFFVLAAKVLPLRPDFVVVMHNVNDLGALRKNGHYWPMAGDDFTVHLLERAPPTWGAWLKEARLLLIPHAYHHWKTLKKQWKAERKTAAAVPAPAAVPTPAPSLSPEEIRQRVGWIADYKSAMTQFVATVQAWGIRPVVMTQVLQKKTVQQLGRDGGDYLGAESLARQGIDKAQLDDLHAAFNQTAREVARERGALLVDLEQAVEGGVATQYDGLHFHDAGSERVARVVADRLQPEVARLAGMVNGSATTLPPGQ